MYKQCLCIMCVQIVTKVLLQNNDNFGPVLVAMISWKFHFRHCHSVSLVHGC